MWGSEPRFFSEKKGKKVDEIPGPGHYKVVPNWGPDPMNPQADKKKWDTNLFNRLSNGVTKSIYYS